jgi:hypothetical protein
MDHFIQWVCFIGNCKDMRHIALGIPWLLTGLIHQQGKQSDSNKFIGTQINYSEEILSLLSHQSN